MADVSVDAFSVFHAYSELEIKMQARYAEAGMPIDCLGKDSKGPFCIASNAGDTETATSLETFLSEGCHWQDGGSKMMPLAVTTSYSSTDYCCDGEQRIDTARYAAEYCADASSGWIALRYGPFITSGGNIWNGVLGMFNDSLLPTYHIEGVHALEAYAIGSLDERNAMVGFPPIHQHHFHLFGSGNPQHDVMNAHGDSQCADEDGGVRCLIRSAPEGMAWFIRDRFGFETEFNDVRPNHSTPLSTWVFVALKPARASTPLRQIRERLVFSAGLCFLPPARQSPAVHLPHRLPPASCLPSSAISPHHHDHTPSRMPSSQID